MVEKDKIIDVEHQCHHHHIKQQLQEGVEDFQPVITANPKMVNRALPDVPHHGASEQQEEQKKLSSGEKQVEEPSWNHIPLSMEAVVVNDVNKEEPWESLLIVQQYPTPTQFHVQDDEVLVKMHAASVNPIDFKLNQMEITQRLIPFVGGKDGAGEIVYMGDTAKKELHGRLTLGDHVLGVTSHSKYGTYAEYAVFHYSNLAKKPQSLTWEQAGALPLAVLTIWQCFSKVPLQVKNPVQRKRPLRVLIHGASGGTGSIAVLLAKHYFDADCVYATCSEKNASYVKNLGADRVIDYEKEMFEQVIQRDYWNEQSSRPQPISESDKEAFKGYVNVIIDTVGGYDLWKRSCDILDHESYFCSIAAPHELEEHTSVMELLKFGGTIVMEKLKHWTTDHPNFYWVLMDNDEKALEHLAEFLANKMDKVNITTFDLLEAKKAQEMSYNHHAVGKIVLKIGRE